GYVIYDESVRSAAENRLATTLAQLREIGIEAEGEVMDPDPFAATTDAVDHFEADEIIISTHPETRSGWLRKALVDRVKDATGLPVEHVVVDLDAERADTRRVLVVANQTVGGDPLIEKIRAESEETPSTFVVILPQGESGEHGDAHERLAHTLKRLQDEGIEAVGQVMDPDPFTAVQNALQFYPADEIIISTFPETRSGWMRADLIERVQRITSKPVEHVVVEEAQA
ncbi:MAG TPA: hypothetical protein VF712_00470, partial [Thermoleophilaceae bacterium]